jgi:hypothetical protein
MVKVTYRIQINLTLLAAAGKSCLVSLSYPSRKFANEAGL